MVALDILSDGFFAAIAGIGFGAISDPPLRAFKMIAILAALGHACRFCLMTYLGVDILPDDGAVYSRIAPDDSGKICVQHGILSYYVLADSE